MTDEMRSKPGDSDSPQERLPEQLRSDLGGLFGGSAEVPERVDKAVSGAAEARFKAIRAQAANESEPVAGRIDGRSRKPAASPFSGKSWWLGPAVGAAVAACLMFAFVFLMPEANRTYEQAAMSAKPNSLAESESKKDGYADDELADAASERSALSDSLGEGTASADRLRPRDSADAAGRFGSLEGGMDSRKAGADSSANLRRQASGIDEDSSHAPQVSAESNEPAPAAQPASPRAATAPERYQQKLGRANSESPRHESQSAAKVDDHSVQELKEASEVESTWDMAKADPKVGAAQRPDAAVTVAPGDVAAEADTVADNGAVDGNASSVGEVAESETQSPAEMPELAQAGERTHETRSRAIEAGEQLGGSAEVPAGSGAGGSASTSPDASTVGGKRELASAAEETSERSDERNGSDDRSSLVQADVDESGVTDIADVIALAKQFITPGQAGNMRWDMTGDGHIDDLDMLAVARIATAHMAEMHKKQRDSNGDDNAAVAGPMLTNAKGKDMWFSISVPVAADQQLVACQFTISLGENGRVSEVVTLASNTLNRVVVDRPLPATGDVHVAVYTSQSRLLGQLQAVEKRKDRKVDLASDVALPMSIIYVQIKPGDVVFRPAEVIRGSALCVFSDMSVQQVQPQIQRRYIDVMTKGVDGADPAASVQERE